MYRQHSGCGKYYKAYFLSFVCLKYMWLEESSHSCNCNLTVGYYVWHLCNGFSEWSPFILWCFSQMFSHFYNFFPFEMIFLSNFFSSEFILRSFCLNIHHGCKLKPEHFLSFVRPLSQKITLNGIIKRQNV